MFCLFQMSIHIQNGLLYVFGIILNGSIWLFGAVYEGKFLSSFVRRKGCNLTLTLSVVKLFFVYALLYAAIAQSGTCKC